MKLIINKIICTIALLAAFSFSPAFADIVVKGKVCDAKGEPLPGVAVVIKDSYTGTVTDFDGKFTLSSTPDDCLLLFSCVGYKSEERAAAEMIDVVMQEDAQMLGDVVVTTQKRRQTSIEVPVAVSAMAGLSLERMNLQQLDEMAPFIPGLQVQIQSPNNPGYVIRGVTSDGGESYSQPRISAFMDGVSITRSRASVVELFDLERIEVVKGPQGTLFGRGAEIGAMHIIRNKPVNTLGGEIALNYGSYNQRGATGYINTPIVKDKLANRFAFSYDAHDGYIDNLSGGDLNGKSAVALRNSTRMFGGQSTVIDLVLDYQHDDYPGTSFKSKRIAPTGGDTDPNTAASLERGKDLGIKRDVGGVTLQVNSDLNDKWKFTSITGFRAFKSDELFDADGTYLKLLDCEEYEKGTQLSQEFRLNYDNRSWFSGFVGASYFYEHSMQDVTVITNMQQLYPAYIQSVYASTIGQLTALVPQLASLLGLSDASLAALQTQLDALTESWFSAEAGETVTNLPDVYGDLSSLLSYATGGLITLESLEALLASGMYDSALESYGMSAETITSALATLKATSDAALEESYEEQATNYATNQAAEIFADGTFHLTKGLSLTLGLRGTYEHQKTGYSSTTVPHAIFGTIMYAPSDGRVYASDDYYSWVGRAALNYLFKRNNAYVSISRGRRPGVISFNNNPDDIVKLKPEIIVSYEAGVKGSVLKSRLGYDLSVYYYDWNHFQTTRLSDSSTSLTRIYEADDAGKAHSFGVEAGLRYAITSGISIFGNYSYIDGKFNDHDGDGQEQEYAGNRFRLTPKNSFAAGIDVNIPLRNAVTVYIRPSYSYKSKVYFEEDNNPELTQDGYGLANFTAGVRLQPNKVYYEVSAFGRNVFNEKYIVDAGNTGYQIDFPTFVAGNPSVFGGQLKIGF